MREQNPPDHCIATIAFHPHPIPSFDMPRATSTLGWTSTGLAGLSLLALAAALASTGPAAGNATWQVVAAVLFVLTAASALAALLLGVSTRASLGGRIALIAAPVTLLILAAWWASG